MKKHIIIVKIHHGYCSDVINVPSGITVRVWDFNIDGIPEERLTTIDGFKVYVRDYEHKS